jgi:hypothetical protein
MNSAAIFFSPSFKIYFHLIHRRIYHRNINVDWNKVISSTCAKGKMWKSLLKYSNKAFFVLYFFLSPLTILSYLVLDIKRQHLLQHIIFIKSILNSIRNSINKGTSPRIIPWLISFLKGSSVGAKPLSFRIYSKTEYNKCPVACSLPPMYKSTLSLG